jgi:cardiolipin synthase
MDWIQIIYAINAVVTVFAIMTIILSNRESTTSVIWIILILVFPFIGLLIFVLLGVDWQKHKLLSFSPEEALNNYRTIYSYVNNRYMKRLYKKNSDVANDLNKLIHLIEKGSHSSLTYSDSHDLYFKGQDFFDSLFEDLSRAEKTIHMDFFIWKSDKLGEKIKDILIEKVAQGVEIRLIFDGFGSLMRISNRYRRELKKAGIEYHYFLDLRDPSSRHKINYNNHKKIVTIDGKIGYLGGMNIGQEYIDGGRRFESWRDTQLRLTGSCITLLDSVFLADWSNCIKKKIDYPHPPEHKEESEAFPLQIAVSGPDSEWYSVKLAYISMITNANREVLIQSPYFVPDNSMLDALESAALSGIDVHFMITGKPDKWTAWWAAQTYLEEIIRAGVKVYFYEAGFLHSKVFVVDELISSVGTCNMDIRSFHLHYEINAMLYSPTIAGELKEQFYKDRENCRQIALKDFKELGFLKRFRNSLCRMASPFM